MTNINYSQFNILFGDLNQTQFTNSVLKVYPYYNNPKRKFPNAWLINKKPFCNEGSVLDRFISSLGDMTPILKTAQLKVNLFR